MKLAVTHLLCSIVLLTGCSNEPSKSEIQTSLDNELQSICFIANSEVTDLVNTMKPEPSNDELMRVKFEAVVKVTPTDEMIKTYKNHKRVKDLYIKAMEDLEVLNKERSPTIDLLGKKISTLSSEIYKKRSIISRYSVPEGNDLMLMNLGVSYEKSQEIVTQAKLDLKDMEQEELELEELANQVTKKYQADRETIIRQFVKNKTGLSDVHERDLSVTHAPYPALMLKESGCITHPILRQMTTWIPNFRISEEFLENGGYATNFTIEREMQKTKKGWVFVGQM